MPGREGCAPEKGDVLQGWYLAQEHTDENRGNVRGCRVLVSPYDFPW